MSRGTSSRSRLSEGLLNAALLGGALVFLVLLYGFASRTFFPRTNPVRADATSADATNTRIKVEVQNSTGVDGLARDAGLFLRRRGFDVVETGNGAAADSSYVILRAGAPADARHVAGALGLAETAVDTTGSPNDYSLDVTVVLGPDYATLTPFSQSRTQR